MITYKNGFNLPVKQIYDLLKSVYGTSDTFANRFEEEYPSIENLSENLEQLKVLSGSLFLVAVDGTELLGYIFLKPRSQSNLKHTADLNMGVVVKARGKGVGKGILKAALVDLSSKAVIEIIYLMVRSDNVQAIKLYETQCFEVLTVLEKDTKIASRYYDGVLMRKFIL